FKTPLVPLVPILSILFCGVLIVSLSYLTLLRLVIWLVIGLVIYFTYGRKHSRVQNNADAPGKKQAPTMAD
ncbi:MAG: amino acid permease C-terminal domain-containing protein, partial [Candidatus Angelobacter sp.]